MMQLNTNNVCLTFKMKKLNLVLNLIYRDRQTDGQTDNYYIGMQRFQKEAQNRGKNGETGRIFSL